MTPAPDYEANHIRDYEYWSVYLHESQRYLGRTYIALAREGDIDPFVETTPNEQSELLMIVSGLKTVLHDLYQPTRLNYDNLRNAWHHCHWHVVPRYDTPRIVEGVEFVDENVGKNWPPFTPFPIPESLHARIRSDIAEALYEVN